MKAYKLTDQHDQTYSGCQWGESITHKTIGEGGLCGPGWIHFYKNPLLAVFLNPIHANFDPATMHLWEGTAKGNIKGDRGLKWGCTQFTTLKQVEIPLITETQKIAFGILCAQKVYPLWKSKDKNRKWNTWAKNWLNGTDRSRAACEAACEAASGAASRAASGSACEAASRAANCKILNLNRIAKEAMKY